MHPPLCSNIPSGQYESRPPHGRRCADGVKTARLNEIIALQNELSLRSNRLDVGREFEVLVEGVSKRSDRQLFGRTSQNKVVVFDRAMPGWAITSGCG